MPNIIETTDAAASTGTTYTLGIGQSAQGSLTVGDADWYRVSLVAGQTYTFALVGTRNGAISLDDPFLNLRNSAGDVVAFNDDAGPGLNSQITFTATTTGVHYIDVGSYGLQSAGQYGVSVTQGSMASFNEHMGAGVITRSGMSWSTPGTPATITWGVRASASGGTDPAGGGPFSTLSAAEIAAVQSVLAHYSEVAQLTFVQVNPGGTTNNATMLFANFAQDGEGSYAYLPGTSPGNTAADSVAGDVWLNISGGVSTTSLPPGSYSYSAILHETGHALGLNHPGNYNFTPGSSIEYETHAQFIQDSDRYTLMTYFDESNTDAYYYDHPQTLMLFDILAVQQLYGVNYNTRAGNTVYGFGSNAGGVYDFSTNSAPALCIWDGGGIDTLNVSGFSQAAHVDLREGMFSSVGGYVHNISIAFGAVIENAVTGAGADTLIGNAAANVLNGGAGADTMQGLGGNDTYYVDNRGDVIIEAVGGGTDRVLASTHYELTASAEVEQLSTTDNAGTTAINLVGNAFAQTLTGNNGANVLNGMGGADVMYGLGGNDTYYVDNAGDVVVEAVGGGSDRVLASISYALAASAEVEQLSTTNDAGTAAINLTGNAFAQTLIGNNGANVLNGMGGADVMAGLGGNDMYYVDNRGDVIVESVGGGNDRVLASVHYELSAAAEVEHLSTTDNAGTTAINLVGNAFAQMLTGNNGANVLNGMGGADIMYGLGGNDMYYVDNAGDVVVEAVGGGNDRVLASVSYTLASHAEVEHLSTTDNAGTTAINLVGNAFAQMLTGNNGANVLNGMGGADIMYGLGGNDMYYVDNAGDVVVEAVGGGNDRVLASVDYALASHAEVEHLSTTDNAGTAAINLAGNGFGQMLWGNAGNNVLNGLGGNDLLYGLGGADTFVFSTALGAGNIDTIADYEAADTIRLNPAIFSALPLGILAASAFRLGTAALDADDRIIYNQSTGALFYDADGVGGAAQIQFATLANHFALTASEFVVA